MSRLYARQYASQLLFEVHPSKIHKNIIFIIFFITLFAMAMINTGLLVIDFFVVLLLVYFTVHECRNNRLRQFHWREDGSWLIHDSALQSEMLKVESSLTGSKSGAPVWAELMPGSVITPRFALLNFKLGRPAEFQNTHTISVADFYSYFTRWIEPENRNYLSVLLFTDSIERDKFRQLRVRLKVEGITKPARGTL